MKYKALILDLDGTVIPIEKDSRPTAKIVQSIQKAKVKLHVCVATNRPLFMAKAIIKELGILDVCSVHDATQVYDPQKDEIIEVIELDSNRASQAYNVIKKYQPISVFVGNREKEYEYTGGRWPKGLCNLAIPDISIQTANSMITELTKIEGISVHKMPAFKKGLFWLAIANARATKLHAVVRMCELLKIHPREAIGVGDSYNDFPLLEACGLKIAMGNAAPELKAIADFVAPSVDDDGVATVIEKFVLSA